MRQRNIYNPEALPPFKLSRTKIESFIQCPRCFYLDRRLGISQPPMPGFTLNTAVDHLLKNEFDYYRKRKEPHPIMIENNINAIPFEHPDLDIWRENFKGVQFHHKATNFIITGAVDDVWCLPDGTLIVVDYKSTSINGEVTLEGEWKEAYKRQMDMYQWLFRRNGFNVSHTGYFVYANGIKGENIFENTLQFDTRLLSYKGDDSWVEPAIFKIKTCLDANSLPPITEGCEYCQYRLDASTVEK